MKKQKIALIKPARDKIIHNFGVLGNYNFIDSVEDILFYLKFFPFISVFLSSSYEYENIRIKPKFLDILIAGSSLFYIFAFAPFIVLLWILTGVD